MECMLLDILCTDVKPQMIESDMFDKCFVNDIDLEESPRKANVLLFCRRPNGRSVAFCIEDWLPWIRFELPESKYNNHAPHQIQKWVSSRYCKNPLYTIQKLRRFYGYDASEGSPDIPQEFAYLDIRMPSFGSASMFQKDMQENGPLHVCDAQQQWPSKFCNDLGLVPSDWFRIDNLDDASNHSSVGKWSNCDEEYTISYKQIVSLQDRTDIAPIKILSFDGEMYSHDGLFPNVSKGDFTSVICASILQYGNTSFVSQFKGAVSKKALGSDVLCFPDSCALIEAFRDYIIKEDPDILTGWNIYGFDFAFLYEDYMRHYRGNKAPEQYGLFLSRICSQKAKFIERTMASSAKGDNRFRYLEMPGRITVDLMQIVKDDKKPEDNSLKHIAHLFLDPEFGKMDVTAHEMFEAWKTENMQMMQKTVDYCTRDAEIPLHLIEKLVYLPSWIEMSRVCYTPLMHVLNGGQQRRVFNVISRFVHKRYALNTRDSGWPIQDLDIDDDTKKKPDYQGATVIEPVSGFYQDPVSVMDFESLYPSIMIYFNLCPSVLMIGDSSKLNVPKDTHTIVHTLQNDTTETRTYTFAKHITGVLPQLLRHLLKSRKAVKALMNQCTDPFQKFVLNGRQNALKVVCNSVYGFTGVSLDKGLLPCKPVAAVTTLKGRAFIEAAKNYVEKEYNAKVLYGDTDSIMVLWAKQNGIALSIENAYALGDKVSQEITNVLRSSKGGIFGEDLETFGSKCISPKASEARMAIRLANEKVECPYLLIRKKMYAAVKWTPSKNGSLASELEYKGIDAVRRDRTKVVRELSETVLNKLMIENNVEAALSALKNGLASILDNRVPLDDYVLSKSLKGTYASENVPHVAAWKRMQARGDPGLPPQGSRMPMIFVMPKDPKNVNLYDIAEHPEYVKRMQLKPWAYYYINNIRNVMERLFEPTQIPVSCLFDDAEQRANHMASNTKSLLKRDENIQLEPVTKKKRKVEVKSKTLF